MRPRRPNSSGGSGFHMRRRPDSSGDGGRLPARRRRPVTGGDRAVVAWQVEVVSLGKKKKMFFYFLENQLG
jgi:hypothetical protein